MNLLITYLNSESLQIRTCINGTLYSLLQKKDFRQLGLSIELDIILSSLIDNTNQSSEQMNKQVQYIIDALHMDIEDEINDEEKFVDENNDEDEMIDENYLILFFII